MKPIQQANSIIWINCATSSNSLLRERAKTLANLSIIAVREQTAGRGQGNHTWTSDAGKNLTFSILYKFDNLAASDAILVTHITTLAICDYLSSKGVQARIKWPNDIWVSDKKIAGILIENEIESGCVCRSIVGIGLNINQMTWPEEIPNPVSLSLLSSGCEYDLESELILLHSHISSRFSQAHSDRIALQSDFDSLIFHLG